MLAERGQERHGEGGNVAWHSNAIAGMVEGGVQARQGQCCGAPEVLGLQGEEPKLGQHCSK